MTTTPNTSAAHASRVLAAAGIPKSTSHATRVRGHHNATRGFRAMQASPTQVVVEYVCTTDDHRAAGLDRCAKALEAAGLVATQSRYWAGVPVLVVTKATP